VARGGTGRAGRIHDTRGLWQDQDPQPVSDGLRIQVVELARQLEQQGVPWPQSALEAAKRLGVGE
jgi:hypothetical protein